jgi:hypothetical protein
MRQQIDTIPVIEAFETTDECPLCALERKTEQRCIRYVLGPGNAYMEPEVRYHTDRQGFCRDHIKKLYDYHNPLGCGLVMQSWLRRLRREFGEQKPKFRFKRRLFAKKNGPDPFISWGRGKLGSCYICKNFDENMRRYYATFFYLCKDPEFKAQVEKSKGFCMRHFMELLERGEKELWGKDRQWFLDTVFPLMEENLSRMQAELDWYTEKFDYKNSKADWGTSRDALQRAIQKYQGLYPADPPYKMD